MTKKISIEGMSCAGCSGRIQKLLNAIPGVTATVSLEDKEAVVDVPDGVTDQKLIDTIDGAGYKVVSIA